MFILYNKYSRELNFCRTKITTMIDPWAKYSTKSFIPTVHELAFSDFTQTMFEPRCEMCRYIHVSPFYLSYTLLPCSQQKSKNGLIIQDLNKVHIWFIITGVFGWIRQMRHSEGRAATSGEPNL